MWSAGQPASLPASLPASQPAVRPGCARCRALKITQNTWLLCRIYETVVPKTIFPLRHGDFFVLPSITLYSIATRIIKIKKVSRDIDCATKSKETRIDYGAREHSGHEII